MNVFDEYETNAPDVVAEDFDGEIVILNLAQGIYFSIAGMAHPIWVLLISGKTPHAILSSIESQRPELAEPSRAFIERLVEMDLIRPRPNQADGSTDPIDTEWLGEAPKIEVFDDLAELILADPIHDVDEKSGWPVQQPDR